jgi:hypothetical protein
MKRSQLIRLFLVGLMALFAFAFAPQAAVFAGQPVDPATLNPVPPSWYACIATGSGAICRGHAPFSGSHTNEPTDWACSGTSIYSTGVFNLDATRYYDRNGNLTRRANHASETDALSLSPTGAGPIARLIAQWTFTYDYITPGDTSAAIVTVVGSEIKILAPGSGVITQDTGRTILYRISDAMGDDVDQILFQAGPHSDINLTALCAALAP